MCVHATRYPVASCSIVERDSNSDGLGNFRPCLTDYSERRQYSNNDAKASIESGSKTMMGTPEAHVAEPRVPANGRHNTERLEQMVCLGDEHVSMSDVSINSPSLMGEVSLEDSISEFSTAQTAQSKSTFYTAELPREDASLPNAARALPFRHDRQLPPNINNDRPTALCNSDHEYYRILQSKSLWPVDFMEEQDWSGRGQHAEFQRDERNKVDEILRVQELLGSTSSAIVHSVKCKRIFLARKTILCNRRMTKAKAIEEVAHLYRLSHAHVVRVVGTYTLGAELSILIYPAAEYNLETFLDRLISRVPAGLGWKTMLRALPQFVDCLANAMAHIHDRMTKHMDIKPRNLLVRHICIPPSDPRHVGGGLFGYKIYIADFGIARSYATLEDMETEGPLMFTRKYAAPEVVDKGPRGRPADIFSLGCVFVEIYATWLSAVQIRSAHVRREGAAHGIREKAESEITPLFILQDLLMANSYGDSSYQANIDAVKSFLSSMSENTGLDLRELAQGMILEDPAKRLTAIHLVNRVGTAPCCKAGSDRLEAARWREIEIEESYNMMNGTRSLLSVS